MKKRTKKKIVKVDIKVRKEIKSLCLIVDYKGNVFRPPYKSKDGRIWRLKQLKPFNHPGIISAIQYKNKVYNLATLLDEATNVNYTKRYECLKSNVPNNIKHLISDEYEGADTMPNKYFQSDQVEKRMQCKEALKKLMELYSYKQIEFYVNNSFAYDCVFYKTEVDNVLITDYDLLNQVPLNDYTAAIVNRITGKQIIVTFEFIDHASKAFKSALKKLSEQ